MVVAGTTCGADDKMEGSGEGWEGAAVTDPLAGLVRSQDD